MILALNQGLKQSTVRSEPTRESCRLYDGVGAPIPNRSVQESQRVKVQRQLRRLANSGGGAPKIGSVKIPTCGATTMNQE
ncbi:hypothetical protein ABIB48_003008 [Arthrobacter sp. UYCu511]